MLFRSQVLCESVSPSYDRSSLRVMLCNWHLATLRCSSSFFVLFVRWYLCPLGFLRYIFQLPKYYVNQLFAPHPAVFKKAELTVHSSYFAKSCIENKRLPSQLQEDSKGIFPLWQWSERLLTVLETRDPLKPLFRMWVKPAVNNQTQKKLNQLATCLDSSNQSSDF